MHWCLHSDCAFPQCFTSHGSKWLNVIVGMFWKALGIWRGKHRSMACSFLPVTSQYRALYLPHDAQILHQINKSAVALAFEEVRTPYTSGWEICKQKSGNAYQRKGTRKQMTHLKSTFTTVFFKRLSGVKCRSQTMRAFLSKYLSVLRPSLVFLRPPCSSCHLAHGAHHHGKNQHESKLRHIRETYYEQNCKSAIWIPRSAKTIQRQT